MGMEDFFLGAVAGGAQAGAQGASAQYQHEMELQRQASLLDLQQRYKSQQISRRNNMLFEGMTPEQRESLGVEGPEDLAFALSDVAASLRQQEAKSADLEREQNESLQARSDLVSTGLTPEQARLVERGVADIGDFLKETDTDVMTLEEAEIIAPLYPGITPAQVRALSRHNELPTAPLGNRNQEQRFTSVFDRERGITREVPVSKLPDLLAQTDSAGEPLYETGEVKSVDGEMKFVTNRRVIDIPAEGKESDAVLDPRARFQANVDKRTQTESFRKHNLDGVNPEELGKNLIGASGGPGDSFAENVGVGLGLGALPLVPDDLGQRQVAGSIALRNIRSELQAALGLGSKPLSAILENVFKQIPVPQGLGALRPGSDQEVEASLKQARISIRQGIRTGQRVMEAGGGESPAETEETIIRLNKVLGQVNTLLADRELRTMTIPVARGGSENLTAFDSLQELTARIGADKLARMLEDDQNEISEKQQQYLKLWIWKLRAERGFE